MRMSTNFKQRRLLTLGTCFAKITRSGKVHLQVTCLDFLAKHALHKVWLKPSAEMTFLYGNNVAKAGLGKITDAADQHAGVVVHSMQDAPLGFGVLARSASGCKDMPPTASIILHQADVGEYRPPRPKLARAVAATPRPRRGSSFDDSRRRAAATTQTIRGDGVGAGTSGSKTPFSRALLEE